MSVLVRLRRSTHRFASKYADEKFKVAVVAINSNAVAANNLDTMKQRAVQKKSNFAYLKDETQKVARAFDAICTPEFYVLNRDRKIVYRGAMDDSTKADGVRISYVERAVESALQNEPPK